MFTVNWSRPCQPSRSNLLTVVSQHFPNISPSVAASVPRCSLSVSLQLIETSWELFFSSLASVTRSRHSRWPIWVVDLSGGTPIDSEATYPILVTFLRNIYLLAITLHFWLKRGATS